MLAMRASILSDQGAFFADAQPTKFRAGLFHICTGSYDIPNAHVSPGEPSPTRLRAAWPIAARSGSRRPAT
jgi:hypothetical protein